VKVFVAGDSWIREKSGKLLRRLCEESLLVIGRCDESQACVEMHRDVKIHSIFEGTSEIQQLVIARAISGLRVE